MAKFSASFCHQKYRSSNVLIASWYLQWKVFRKEQLLPTKYLCGLVFLYEHLILRCSKAWLGMYIWGSVNYTGFRLWSWYLVNLLAIKRNLIMTFWSHPFFKWREKLPSKRLQKPEQFPLVLGSLHYLVEVTSLSGYSSFKVNWTCEYILWKEFKNCNPHLSPPHNSIKLHYEAKS